MQQLQLPAPVTRFAPTPSGFLHIGNVYSFVITWLWARKNHGQILLRIDDLDRERVRPAYVDNIFQTLEWLGLDWDLGPSSATQFESEFSQRHRMGLYQDALGKLAEAGAVFGCNCSRRMLKELGVEDAYPGICKRKALDLTAKDIAWRLNTDGLHKLRLVGDRGTIETTLPESQHYFIVKRRDGIPAYHLASLVDDEYFGVNAVVRGEDLYESTLAQLALAERLRMKGFADNYFLHHPLILTDGEKLSKSQKSPSVLEEFSGDKQRLLRTLGGWLGLDSEVCGSLDQMLPHFSLAKLPNQNVK